MPKIKRGSKPVPVIPTANQDHSPPEPEFNLAKRIPCLYNQTLTDGYINGLVDKANRMTTVVKNFEKARSALLLAAQKYFDSCRKTLSANVETDSFIEEISIRFETMKKEVSMLYLILSESVPPPQIKSFLETVEIRRCFRAASLMFDVSVMVVGNEVLIVRVPPLLSSQPKWSEVRKNPRRFKHSAWFAREVDHQLSVLSDHIPRFHKKHLSIFRVIPTQKQLYPDNDNIDTKALIDVISLHTGSFDDPKVVSLSSMAAFRDDVKEGSYFIVSNNHNAPPDEKTLLHWIQTSTVISTTANESCLPICKNLRKID